MGASTELRRLLSADGLLLAPGAYDGLTARMVAQAGFAAVYMTGAGVSAAQGYPDYGLLTLTEMVAAAAVLTRSVAIPVISDADTGYGNELNVTRTVREFEARGVAAIHIEDQVSPKRCGFLDGKEVVSREEFVSKIRAAAAARRDPDFTVIGRTDANAVVSFEEAVTRANLALQAGADIAFVEAPKDLAELSEVPRQVAGPCMLNVVPGGVTPILPASEIRALGYRLAIYPGACLKEVIQGSDEALRDLKDTGVPRSPLPGSSVMATFRRLGADDWDIVRQAAMQGARR